MSDSEAFRLTPVDAQALPAAAALALWERSGKYTESPRLTPSEFSRLCMVNEQGDITTYIAEHTKAATEEHVESNAYFVDLNGTAEQVGIGELRYVLHSKSELYTRGPFVGWMATEADYQNRQLGRRRVLIMNLVARALYGEPLRSGGLVSPPARAIWQHLLADGLATIDTEYQAADTNNDIRYRFIS